MGVIKIELRVAMSTRQGLREIMTKMIWKKKQNSTRLIWLNSSLNGCYVCVHVSIKF